MNNALGLIKAVNDITEEATKNTKKEIIAKIRAKYGKKHGIAEFIESL